jgi:hypothetical protein
MEAVAEVENRDIDDCSRTPKDAWDITPDEEFFQETREGRTLSWRENIPQERSCTLCKHYVKCDEPCVYVDRIVGCLDDDEDRHSEFDEETIPQDYMEVINELRQGIAGRRKVDIGRIRAIEDIRIRAVAAMIYARLQMKDIARVMEKSESHIYRMIHKG